MPANHVSVRVMEKVGMRREGPAHYYGIDVVQYSIAREDFRPVVTDYVLQSA
jgi:RimJ/RimL family protein N-acetyltransferase